MGYTHYWRFRRTVDDATWRDAIFACNDIIQAKRELLAGWDGESLLELHTDALSFNGRGDNSHETFDPNNGEEFGFCKTVRKPYDIVVTACLATLGMFCGDAIKISSDGDPEEWVEGVKLASTVLNRRVPNPIGFVPSDSADPSEDQ